MYGHEAVFPLDYLIPSLCIEAITNMTESGAARRNIGSTDAIRRRHNHGSFPLRGI
jgi:hypothetical protein